VRGLCFTLEGRHAASSSSCSRAISTSVNFRKICARVNTHARARIHTHTHTHMQIRTQTGSKCGKEGQISVNKAITECIQAAPDDGSREEEEEEEEEEES